MKKLSILLTLAALTCSASDMSWMYKEDPLTVGKAHKNTNPYLHQCSRPVLPSSLDENRAVRRYNEARREFTACINEHNSKNVKLYNASRDKKQRLQLDEAIKQAHADWEEYINGNKHSKSKDIGIRATTGSNVHTVGHSDPTRITKDFKF